MTSPMPVSYFDSVMSTFEFSCVCGRHFNGPWHEARYEAIGHVEQRHVDASFRKDLDATEDLIEKLIEPSPLNSWEDLRSAACES
jgi:hypothetical protein